MQRKLDASNRPQNHTQGFGKRGCTEREVRKERKMNASSKAIPIFLHEKTPRPKAARI
jgi:hypothetical protein